MKKTTKSIISLLLCICLMIPMFTMVSFAEESYSSATEYVQSSDTGVEIDKNLKRDIFLYGILNKVSNFLINNVVAKALGVIVPDSYAVLDYEEFDVDSYDNFYS